MNAYGICIPRLSYDLRIRRVAEYLAKNSKVEGLEADGLHNGGHGYLGT